MEWFLIMQYFTYDRARTVRRVLCVLSCILFSYFIRSLQFLLLLFLSAFFCFAADEVVLITQFLLSFTPNPKFEVNCPWRALYYHPMTTLLTYDWCCTCALSVTILFEFYQFNIEYFDYWISWTFINLTSFY